MTSPTRAAVADKDLLAVFDARMRAAAEPDEPGARVERAGRVVRQVGATPADWHGVLYASWTPMPRADAVIAAQIAYFGGLLGTEFEWKLYSHDGRRISAPDWRRRASRRGTGDAVRGGDHAAGGRRTARCAAGRRDAASGDDRRRRGLGGRGDGRGVRQRTGDRARTRALARLTADPETVWTWVATADGRPVSTARMLIHPGTGFASLWGGGTAPEWRGRGIYRSLVAHRMRIAAALGCEYLQVDASDQSRPILERLGFRALSVTTPYEYHF